MAGFVQKHQRIIILTLLVLISICAGWYIAVCTKYAPWGFSDSAAYLSAARNFAAGRGLGIINADGSFSPLLIFAPFFSIFLSIFAIFDVDLIFAVRLMDVVLFAILIATSGWLFFLITQSFWGSISFALMMATTPVLGSIFTSIMSEPLALVLGISGFLMMIYALRQNADRWLILSAILAALAVFTRYAFAAFPVAGIFCILLLSNKPVNKKLLDSVKYGIISFGPIFIWISLQLINNQSVGARSYSMDFSISEKLSLFVGQLFAVLKYWLPYRTDMIPGLSAGVFRPILALLITIIIILGLTFGVKKYFASDHKITGLLSFGFVFFIAIYLVELFITYLVSKETISIDDRMLSPVVPLFYALLLSCGVTIGQTIHQKLAFPILSVIIACFFILYNFHIFSTYPIVVGNFPNGYTSPIWKENPILTGEVIVPQGRPLITNAPDIVLFYLNRSAYTLSASTDASGSEQSALGDLIHNQCAVMLLFDPDQTQRFEQLPDSVSAADIAVIQNQLDTLYTSTNGIILADNNCIKK